MQKLIILALCLNPVASGTPDVKVQKLRSFHLPHSAHQRLMKDRPHRTMELGPANDLWILGKSKLWVWNLTKNSLFQIEVGNKLPLMHLKSTGKEIYAATGRSIFTMRWNPFQTLRLNTPGTNRGLGMFLLGDGKRALWVHSSGTFAVHHGGMKKLGPALKINSTDILIWDKHRQSFFGTRGPRLFQVNFHSKASSKTYLFKSTSKILDLQNDSDSLWAAARQKVLRLTHTGKVLQVIPLEDGKKLVGMDISPNQQSYLISDHVIESYHTDRSSTKWLLPTTAKLPAYAKTFIKTDSHAIVLDNQNLQVFQAEKT